MTTIRAILIIVAAEDLHLENMNVNTTFLRMISIRRSTWCNLKVFKKLEIIKKMVYKLEKSL